MESTVSRGGWARGRIGGRSQGQGVWGLRARGGGCGVVLEAGMETAVSDSGRARGRRPRRARGRPRGLRARGGAGRGVMEAGCETTERNVGDDAEHVAYGSEDDSDASDDCDHTLNRWMPPTFQRFQPGDEEEHLAASTTDSQFEWTTFPSPAIALLERREKFEAETGPTSKYPSPYDAFVAIWDRDIMEHIAAETNKYAQQLRSRLEAEGKLRPHSRITRWTDTHVNELYVFFSIIFCTGICVKAEFEDYWLADNNITATPNIGRHMAYNRFSLLSRCLHFSDDRADMQTLTRAQAKILKIAPIVEHLNRKFETLYRLGRNIVIDESLSQWKGPLIKKKAAGDRIKTYEICEPQTGYLWRFKLHAGREKTSALLLDLLSGLESKGHAVFLDGYYTSPALARILKSKGFDCVGPLWPSLQHVLPQPSATDKSDMTHGEIKAWTSGDVDIVKWRDHDIVTMVSTYHGVGVQNVDGKTKPTAVHEYNVCMGAVSKKDQLLSTYPLERKRNRVWYKKLFRRLLNVSILNAYIMYSHGRVTSSTNNRRLAGHRNFRKQLIDELIQNHHHSSMVRARASKHFGNKLKTTLETLLQHYPMAYDVEPNITSLKRSCGVCGNHVDTYCEACAVALCAVGCFKAHHVKVFSAA